MRRETRVGVGVVIVALWVGLATPTSQPSPEIKTEAPPPRPEAIYAPEDCPLYVFGELRTIKRHGETWLNDGSACETCECVDGLKRCYYHYCNAGLTEGFMTPPSDRPFLDDEDLIDFQEGSGQLPDDYYKILHELEGPGPQESGQENEKDQRDNETHHPITPGFCSPPCHKTCPQGYKMDEVRGCQRCKCYKCPSMRGCHLHCPGGLALDHHGCRTCHCQSPKLAVFTTSHDDDFVVEDGMGVGVSSSVYVTTQTDPPCNTTRVSGCSDGHRMYPVGARWGRGPCVSCSCVAPGYTQCNVTQCPRVPCPSHQDDLAALHQAAHPCCPPCTDMESEGHANKNLQNDGQSSSLVPKDHLSATYPHSHTPTPDDLSHHRTANSGASDGTTKSAVQTSPVEWSQLCLIIVPLAVFLLVAALGFHYWRRYHRDKYDINVYRPAETEKLRPVKTADDQLHIRHV
ncbi:cysteine-rich motor neuron 1 protein-like isoform X2 [Homarus americanus]|uniref:cysteine-rich motor neuron 1 protein-like isoform X2 n=1 Tax=Homarus americanus TaxID=6706 RepID=UPI001C464841|nr:cysteine-rich motor neuron 1 protein-like isoform X2 [Homarus americanus]